MLLSAMVSPDNGFLPMNSLLYHWDQTFLFDIQPQIESLSQGWPRIRPPRHNVFRGRWLDLV
jgi:hypothetical protein